MSVPKTKYLFLTSHGSWFLKGSLQDSVYK